MKPTFFKGALVGGIAGAVMAAGTAALAGSGVGGVFNLGEANSVNATSSLTGASAGPQLKVQNTNSSNQAITAVAGSGTGIALYGVHSGSTGTGPGVQGQSASTAAGATGVSGLSSSASSAGDSNGVKGVNNGKGRGVYGQAASGPGVYGNSTTGYGVWGIGHYGLVGGGSQGGVWASTGNAAGAGVFGQNTATGIGVEGLAPGGTGVHGYHRSTIGTGPGVFGETNSTSTGSYGVLARANATNQNRDVAALRAINSNTNQYGMGVWGSIAGSGWGVLGEAGDNGIGVIGKLSGAGTGVQGQAGPGGIGVKGIALPNGFAGQFDGEVDVRGYLRLKFVRTYLPDSDCAGQTGRLALRLDPATNQMQLWVCAPLGWEYLAG
jgi:hypothetical protein